MTGADDFSREPARATRFDWLVLALSIAAFGVFLIAVSLPHA
jgi:hypothetical protein